MSSLCKVTGSPLSKLPQKKAKLSWNGGALPESEIHGDAMAREFEAEGKKEWWSQWRRDLKSLTLLCRWAKMGHSVLSVMICNARRWCWRIVMWLGRVFY